MIRHPWLRPALGILAAIALAWAVVVLFVGGFTIWLGVLRVSSRDPLRALILAVALGALYFRLSRLGEWRRDLQRVHILLLGTLLASSAQLGVLSGLVNGPHRCPGTASNDTPEYAPAAGDDAVLAQ